MFVYLLYPLLGVTHYLKKCSIILVKYINLIVLFLTSRFDIRERFPGIDFSALL